MITNYEFGISLAYSFQIFRPKLLNPKRRVEPIPGNAFPNVIDKVLISSLVVGSCLHLIQCYYQGLVSETEARDLYNLYVSLPGSMPTNSDDSFYRLFADSFQDVKSSFPYSTHPTIPSTPLNREPLSVLILFLQWLQKFAQGRDRLTRHSIDVLRKHKELQGVLCLAPLFEKKLFKARIFKLDHGAPWNA